MYAFDAVDDSSQRHRERLLAVPSGLTEQHDGVGVLREARGEAIEEYVHGVGIDLGEDEREGIVGGRPHGGIEVGGNEALVGEARRTLALRPPAVAIAPLLADPRLVHEPDLDILSRLLGPHRVDLRSEVFLTDTHRPFAQ